MKYVFNTPHTALTCGEIMKVMSFAHIEY